MARLISLAAVAALVLSAAFLAGLTCGVYKGAELGRGAAPHPAPRHAPLCAERHRKNRHRQALPGNMPHRPLPVGSKLLTGRRLCTGQTPCY